MIMWYLLLAYNLYCLVFGAPFGFSSYSKDAYFIASFICLIGLDVMGNKK